MATWAQSNRNSSTFSNFLRRLNDTELNDMANFTFTDVVFEDGTQLKDVKFSQLSEIVWANSSRNTASFSNLNRNI